MIHRIQLSTFVLACVALVAAATVTKASGISVGQSGLIETLDYSDTFTTNGTNRPAGLVGDNSHGAYTVENSYGNPSATWNPGNFSFQTGVASDAGYAGGADTCCGYSGNAGSPHGGNDALSGLAQTGGGNSNFAYGLRSNYVVQADAVLNPSTAWKSATGATNGTFEITSWAATGSAPTGNSLSVQFSDNTITLASPSTSAAVTPAVPFDITDTGWHNFAVNFDHDNNTLGIYVDQTQVADVNLATFDLGAFENYSNAAVGVGEVTGYPTVMWFDNFQVGSAVPEPSSVMALAGMSLLGLAGYVVRRRRRA